MVKFQGLSWILLPLVSSFYIPEVSPVNFKPGQPVEIKVNSLTSAKTGLPYDYYSLPWCRPEKIRRASENIGEIIAGDRIYNSLYKTVALQDSSCQVLCEKDFSKKDMSRFARLIREEYRVQWVVDNLPAVVQTGDRFEFGYRLGFVQVVDGKRQHAINNHLHIIMRYHEDSNEFEGIRIVGVEIVPRSIKQRTTDDHVLCTEGLEDPVIVEEVESILFTYDVEWKSSSTPWEARWEVYLHTVDAEVHWFSIVNSLMIVLLLTGMIAMIMTRILRRDIARYNDEERDPDVDETGWKQLHGDVFRPPSFSTWLAVLVGTGSQLFIMAFVVMGFATLGFLSPANRGGLLTATLMVFVCTSVFSGYFSSRLLKLFLGDAWEDAVLNRWSPKWRICTVRTALFFPTVVLVPMTGLAAVASHEGSSIALPFGVLLSALLLWVGVSIPLTFVGAYFGFRKQAITVPCPPNEIPRMRMEQVWYLHPVICVIVGGILPFGTVFIELFFILSSVWLHQVYHVFGFLLIVMVILIITCAEITIVLCYFQLCSLDYSWWWRAFYTSGSSALYLFAYSAFYFATKLDLMRLSSAVVFFGYTTLMCVAFFLFTGTVGFVSTFFFIRTIYGAVKID